MTKRRVESDIDELNEEVLEELEPDVRTELMLKARAAANEVWIDQLQETCPTYRYEMSDTAFMNRMRLAVFGGLEAIYDLQTAVQWVLLAELHRDLKSLLLFADDPDVAERLAAKHEAIPEQMDCIAELARDYEGYSRFAEETLGVSLEQWLGAVAATGPAVVTAAEAMLEVYADQLSPDDGVDDLPATEAADELFETLTDIWEEDASC